MDTKKLWILSALLTHYDFFGRQGFFQETSNSSPTKTVGLSLWQLPSLAIFLKSFHSFLHIYTFTHFQIYTLTYLHIYSFARLHIYSPKN
jgi:hypothetical protein